MSAEEQASALKVCALRAARGRKKGVVVCFEDAPEKVAALNQTRPQFPFTGSEFRKNAPVLIE